MSRIPVFHVHIESLVYIYREMSSSEPEDSGEKVRSLDVATTASIDLIALNNKIVSMRGTVKQVKVQIIHKLTRQIKLLKNKRCSEEQKEKHICKAQKLGDEVTVIKNLKPDKISKYALGHTASFEEICKQQKVPTETKALARLAEHKLLQNAVKSFRTDHDDWLSLAAFLQSRNSGRRIKKKRSNKVEKIMTNVKAGEVIVKSFLEKRLEGQPEILEKLEKPLTVSKSVDDLKKDYISEKPSQNEGEETVVYEEGDKMTLDISEKREKVTSQSSEKWENVTSDISESSGDVSDNSDIGDNSDSEISISNEKPELSKNTTQKISKQKITPPSLDAKEKNKKQIMSENYESENTETVVRRLNMEEFCKDSTIDGKEDVPFFLVSSKSDKSIEKKKKKDAFFVTSDDSSDDEVSDTDDNVERMNMDVSDEEEELSRGKHAFRSTFLGSLSEKDWRKSAEERNKTNHLDREGAKRGGKFKRDGAKKTGKFDRYGDKRGEKFAQQNTNKYSKGTMKKPEPAFTKSRSNQGPSNKRQDGKRPAPEDFKEKTEEEKLHPSWLASKKRKEQAAIQTFQGKKITFDDD